MKSEKNKPEYLYSIKFIIVGDQGVGKTNILHHFSEGKFSNSYNATIGIDYLSHDIKIDNRIFHLQIWDTAGHERFRSVTKGYYSKAACALIIYDITDYKSLESVKNWIDEIKLYSNPNIYLILVGNKIDLKSKRVISIEKGKQLAEKYELDFFESSALTGENINSIFFKACRVINENITNEIYDFNNPTNGIKISNLKDSPFEIKKDITIISSDENNGKKKKSKCKC